jgi:hypothetical protein
VFFTYSPGELFKRERAAGLVRNERQAGDESIAAENARILGMVLRLEIVIIVRIRDELLVGATISFSAWRSASAANSASR